MLDENFVLFEGVKFGAKAHWNEKIRNVSILEALYPTCSSNRGNKKVKPSHLLNEMNAKILMGARILGKHSKISHGLIMFLNGEEFTLNELSKKYQRLFKQ